MGRRTIGSFVVALKKNIADEQAVLDEMQTDHAKRVELQRTKIDALRDVLDSLEPQKPVSVPKETS
jgi:hypothetical protein